MIRTTAIPDASSKNGRRFKLKAPWQMNIKRLYSAMLPQKGSSKTQKGHPIED